jgi:cysteine desulfurase
MALKLPIYMDYHATTPVDPRVFEAMAPYFTEKFGNAASRSHVFGWQAAEAVEKARQQVAALIHAAPKEIVFTSGATESNNTAIKGVARALAARGNQVITCGTEHKSVLDSCKRLEKEGVEVTFLPVDRNGQLDPDGLRRAISPKTVLVTVMAANNETGVLQPIAEIGRICAEAEVLFHTDAVQAAGKVPFDVRQINVDLVSLTAHKLCGPKGIGALYVRRRDPPIPIVPLIDGGGQEGGLRSGTPPVQNIVGFGQACELAAEERPEESQRLAGLRDRLRDGILTRLDGVEVNGHPAQRLPGNLNLSFADVDGESLMLGMPDVAVSSGAACSSANAAPSHVLLAMGIGEERARTSIRFGLGRFTTSEEVDYVIERVCELVSNLRQVAL